MTYLRQDNDFVKSSNSITLFEAYFMHLLGTLPECNAFFEFLCGIFASKNFLNLHAVSGVIFEFHKFIKICRFSFAL